LPLSEDHCLLSRRTLTQLKSEGLLSHAQQPTAGEEECAAYVSAIGCGWTEDWNCPEQTGGFGKASDDGSLGWACCCGERSLWRQPAPGPSLSERHACTEYLSETGCSWTSTWNCPGQSGGVANATNDGTVGYKCCCKHGYWHDHSALVEPTHTSLQADTRCSEYVNSAGCGWTSSWNCPGQHGGAGVASHDGTLGYECCCEHGWWRRAGWQAIPDSHAR